MAELVTATKKDLARNLWSTSGNHEMETFSGDLYDFFDPNPDSIHLRDIAHALANTCRFGGHIRQPYNVAQHSVLCSRMVELWDPTATEEIVGALFHDAHEAYLGDCPRPLKRWFEPKFGEFTVISDRAIAEALDIDDEWFHGPLVKRADNLTVEIEANLLLTYGPGGHPELDLPDGITVADFNVESSAASESLFIHRAKELGFDE